jgi:chromosome condensin MukBEF ATPase and DNA-binding subunit MukB
LADRDAQQQRLMEEQANRYKAKLEELAVRHQRKMAEAQEKMAAEAADRCAAADETHASMLAEFDTKMSSLASKLQAMAVRETKLVQRLNDVTAEMGRAR